jgi:DNA-binding CsgD family transcriptional regulator
VECHRAAHTPGMARTEVGAARALFDRRAWGDARAEFIAADAEVRLAPDDLERLAVSAYMLALDDEYLTVLERAHREHLSAGDTVGAVRCGFWIGLNLMTRGAIGPARGWFGRVQRMLESEQSDCVERGYLVIPAVLEHVVAGDPEAAHDAAAEAAAIASRFGDKDLLALALHEQGHALVRLGRMEEGLRLMDETMVSVVAGELSPRVTGIVYCNTIAFCQSVFEVRRAREWTEHLTRWCEAQPDMVAHTGVCLVHRAEIMELQGAWPDALVEARRAAERFEELASERPTRGRALYLEGELNRLQGRLGEAEAAYRAASRCGYEPQPGLALLRLQQGKVTAASAAIRRALDETSRRLDRVPLLAASVEIAIAADEVDMADDACLELGDIAAAQRNEAIGAMAARARGEVALVRGEAHDALVPLRNAARAWQALDAPYEAARARILVAHACRALGDEDAAALELDAARDVLVRLGAAADAALIDGVESALDAHHGLTPRELEVLRLVAAGATNRAIAAELVLSERTVDRHVSNIFAKLRVASRAAATAYAYEHRLVGDVAPG